MLLYYITDRMQLGDEETSRRRHLLKRIEAVAVAGVEYIQLRERDLPARELERLATEAVHAIRAAKTKTKFLINSRVDVALAVGADGVHLRSDDMTASEARAIWAKSAGRTDCVIGVSCHSLENVLGAEAHGADFAVLGPIFGKQGSIEPAIGVDAIARVVRRDRPVDAKVEAGQKLRMPVFTLGGITVENSAECRRAGAAGVSGIRLFQLGDVAETVTRLRSI